MDAFTTPGAFSWSELMTSDAQAASRYYGALFGWQFDTMDLGPGGTYHVVKVGGHAVGGLMAWPPGGPSMPPTWSPYVTVADVDACADRCRELGGEVRVPPTDIPGVGRFAVLVDPQGAALNVIAYSPPSSGA